MSERPRQRVPYLEHFPEPSQPAHRAVLRTWPFRIGRSEEAELTIHSRRVSTLHAEIVDVGGEYVVRDLGSTNGTFVNGNPIQESWIREGDVLHVAHREMRFGMMEVREDRPEQTLATGGDQQRLLREANDLHRILSQRAVSAVFQPIVRLSDRTLVGYETLGRIALAGSTYSIGEALAMAAARGQAARLCRRLRDAAVTDVVAHARPVRVFFNLHPSEMDDGGALEAALNQMALVHDAGHTPVLEIHESAVTDGAAMRGLRERLTALGIRLAYDDFGAGQSRLMELVEVPPDALKLDITLVRDIDRSERRRDLVRAVVQVLADQGVEVLAEGIEREEEAAVCQQLGCHLGQGYHLGRPAPLEPTLR